MSRIYKRDEHDKLRIKPEGWADDLVFTLGGLHQCGQAEDGIYVTINNEAGGVLTNDDARAIQNMIVSHFKQLGGEDTAEW